MRTRVTKWVLPMAAIALTLLVAVLAYAAMLPGNRGQSIRLRLQGTEPGPTDLTNGANANVPGHVKFNGCLVSLDPDTASCQALCRAWDEAGDPWFVDLNCNGTYDSATETLGFGGGTGGGGGSGIGFPYILADSEANAAVITNQTASGSWKFWIDSVAGPIFRCFVGAGPCNAIQDLISGTYWQFRGDGVLFEQMTSAGVHTFHGAGRPKASIHCAASIPPAGSDSDSDARAT